MYKIEDEEQGGLRALNTKTLKDLVGKHIFTGVEIGRKPLSNCDYNINYVKFELDGVVYLLCENPYDGYQSCANLEICSQSLEHKLPQIVVRCVYDDSGTVEDRNDILKFIDTNNGKIFLEIGTERTGIPYPYFKFYYVPENLSINEKIDCIDLLDTTYMIKETDSSDVMSDRWFAKTIVQEILQTINDVKQDALKKSKNNENLADFFNGVITACYVLDVHIRTLLKKYDLGTIILADMGSKDNDTKD